MRAGAAGVGSGFCLLGGEFQIRGERGHVGIAIAGVALQSARNQGIKNRRKGGPHLVQRPGLAAVDRFNQLHQALALKWQFAGKHLKEDHAQRKNVGALIDGKVLVLLGSGVTKRAHERAGSGEHLLGRHGSSGVGALLGQAEIDNFDLVVTGDEDVLRLEIAVDNAGGVSASEGIGDLQGVAHGLANGKAVGGDEMAQRLAVDIFHDDEVAVGLGKKIVDGDDVGVIQSGSRLRLALEALAGNAGVGVGSGGLGERQSLEGDVAIEEAVSSFVDDAHAATADLFNDLVVRYDSAFRHRFASPKGYSSPKLMEDQSLGRELRYGRAGGGVKQGWGYA